MPITIVQKVKKSFLEFISHVTREGVRLQSAYLTLYIVLGVRFVDYVLISVHYVINK